jgi:hypothetical protein
MGGGPRGMNASRKSYNRTESTRKSEKSLPFWKFASMVIRTHRILAHRAAPAAARLILYPSAPVPGMIQHVTFRISRPNLTHEEITLGRGPRAHAAIDFHQ